MLLHTAAEVEHALLTQYLFAAYSLRPGLAIPGTAGRTTSNWRTTIAGIAQEEMGHLLTIQNLLRALGGPLHFARDNFPIISRFHPFPFELRPIGLESLARYIAAEMPDSSQVPDSILSLEQIERVRELSGGAVNRVGVLYQTLIEAIEALPSSEFRTDRDDWQQRAADWRASTAPPGSELVGILVAEILPGADPEAMKVEALRGLRLVADQGESPTTEAEDSHFERFARIFRELEAAPCSFRPSHPLAPNPNTTDEPTPDDILSPEEITIEARLAPGCIKDPVTKLWAQLFNLRYRILLTSLAHLCESGPLWQDEERAQDVLRAWVFEEMTDASGSLRDLSRILIGLDVGGLAGRKAGPTFELPYSLELPGRGRERWCLHLDLIDVTAELIVKIRAEDETTPEQDEALDGLLDRDGQGPSEEGQAPTGRRGVIVRWIDNDQV